MLLAEVTNLRDHIILKSILPHITRKHRKQIAVIQEI
jgi:hypothetical protein